MNHKKYKDKWNAPFICFICFLLVIIVLILQMGYLSLSKEVYGIDMQSFAKSRNTVASVLLANRGTIYDVEGNALAQNISSYTLIAYLDPNRTEDELNPKHVVDKEYTAAKLSTILGEENYDYILKRLNSTSKQVEFGSVGRNITELTRLAIIDLDLPGIDFVETTKRYYPNGNFASYIIGYAKQYTRINLRLNETYDLYDYYKNYFDNYERVTVEVLNTDIVKLEDKSITGINIGKSIVYIKSRGEVIATIVVNVVYFDTYQKMDSTIVGELGIESKFEEILEGVDGYIKYQQDKYGYKIPDTPEEKQDSIDGYDIYLTLDSNIQRFAENAVSDITSNYSPKFTLVSVMDAKTGDILASATDPSFNPNSLPSNMTYQNPLVSYTYEPGSVMKTYTYMCAIEKGVYDGNKTYKTGEYEFDDGTIMHDWNKQGWGMLTYDSGFSYSSNTGIINIIKDYLSKEELKSCLEKYGFGSKTGIELSNEENGSIEFKYETEIMSAGFGQGISTTPIQQLQALSIIANDGIMVKPHIIKKIVDKNTGEETITSVEKSERIVSMSAIQKMKELLTSVISESSPTGYKYYLKDYNIIGKTGTAQIYENGKYLTGTNDYIVSVALMYPKDDPKIIVYASCKQPTDASDALPNAIKELIKNISKYIGIFDTEEKKQANIHIIDMYTNKDLNDVKNELEENKLEVLVIGDGDKIISQYPKKGTKLLENDKVFLITNSTNISFPNIIGWSKSDVLNLCSILNIKCNFSGHGFVKEQSIDEGTTILDDINLDVVLESLE